MISIKRDIPGELAHKKYSFITGNEFQIAPELLLSFEKFQRNWEHLKPDNYLEANITYRFRRLHYFYFHPLQDELLPLSNRAYYQSEEDNALTGGMNRKFAPFLEQTLQNPFLQEIIKFSFWQSPNSKNKALLSHPWETDVHMIRVIASSDLVGEPTPEGIHRDGGDCGFVYLMNRQNVKGAVSTVYNNDQQVLEKSTLRHPMDALLFWDPYVLHSVSSMYPENLDHKAVRDILAFSFFPKAELKRPEI